MSLSSNGAILDDSNSATVLKVSGGTHTSVIDTTGSTLTEFANGPTFKFTNGAGTTVLDVTGKIKVSSLAAAAATQVCRDSSNQLVTCSSSRRYKTDIEYLTDREYAAILKEIRGTHLARFRYTTDRPDLTRVGVIAEEAPTALRYQDDNGNTNIDFMSAELGYTWAGVTALEHENERLTRELAAATKAIGTLGERVAQLERSRDQETLAHSGGGVLGRR